MAQPNAEVCTTVLQALHASRQVSPGLHIYLSCHSLTEAAHADRHRLAVGAMTGGNLHADIKCP